MNLVYGIKDKPKFGQLLVFAFQQVLAILAATIAVPSIINTNPELVALFGEGAIGMSQAAALFGAGVGTLVYQLFTKFRSPVFLGSSFAFLGSMAAAFAGALTVSAGYTGLLLGAIFAGLVYVIIAVIVKFAGINWVKKLMPPVVIGPTVAIIGLSLAGNAIGDLTSGSVAACSPYVALICGLTTLFAVMMFSAYGKKMAKLIPFILGILCGYAVATLFTVIGMISNKEALQVINFAVFKDMQIFAIPDFTFLKAFEGMAKVDGAYIATIAVAYIPVAFVVFAEHIADHKNLSTIIGQELLENPGLHNTLLGDGVGSIAGAFFGGCPNTTYGESVGCVAITRNASVVTITCAAVMCIIMSFFGPFITFLSSIPKCVMGGVCVTLYGFIAVSGLKMIQKINLGASKNLFVVATILITGVGGLSVSFGKITLTTTACALILGIVANLLLAPAKEDA